MVRQIAAFAIPVMLVACGPQSTETLKDHLPGAYELFIGTNQSFSRSDFEKSTLVIKTDGTFEVSCFYKSDQPPVNSQGHWTVDSESGAHFDNFLDCAGVGPLTWGVHGASLVIEDSTKPQILLDPDMNIFYKRSEN